MKIITDNVPRHTIDARELSSEERQEHVIDWAIGASFVRFGGRLYNLAEFKNASGIRAFSDWDGYRPDHEYRGLLFLFVNDGDDCIIGTYTTLMGVSPLSSSVTEIVPLIWNGA